MVRRIGRAAVWVACALVVTGGSSGAHVYAFAWNGEPGGTPRRESIPTSPCLVQYWGGATLACYDPMYRAAVERSLVYRVVDPVGPVKQASGLDFDQLVIIRGLDNHLFISAHWTAEYLFGTMIAPGIADPTPPEPKWLILEELGGKPSVQHLEVSQHPWVAPRPGVPADPRRPWYLRAWLPHHQLNLFEVSNETKSAVESVANNLLRKDKM